MEYQDTSNWKCTIEKNGDLKKQLQSGEEIGKQPTDDEFFENLFN